MSDAGCIFGSNVGVPAPQPTPASCNPAWNPSRHSCGPNHNQDCCRSNLVPGGNYYQGTFRTPLGVDKTYPATVSPFRLDVYEVTVSRWRAFVEHGWSNQQNPPPPGAGKNPYVSCSGWDPSIGTDGYTPFPKDQSAANARFAACGKPAADAGTSEAGPAGAGEPDAGNADPTLPYACASRAEAIAFCAWDGGFLPSDVEWGFAASGGSEQREYPWSAPAGSTLIDAQHATYSGALLSPVGSHSPLGDGRWGQADMAGNAAEWVPDEFSMDGDRYTAGCDDCESFVDSAIPILRGGDASSAPKDVSAIAWSESYPIQYHGLRCARKP
jgi:formylglycine-generating enzyme required for sulfatase activity